MDKQSTPVIVGVGQVRHRPDLDGEFEAIEPARMMVEALDRAARDAGQPELAKQADYVGTVSPLAWGYADTPAVLADMLGAGPGLRHEPKPGGNSPIELLQHAVSAIQSDDAHVAVLAGAESIHARQQAAKRGISLDHWSPEPDPPIDVMFRGQPPITTPLELRHGFARPVEIFPLYENAIRAHQKRSIADHQAVLGRLMSRFSSTAAKNPYAWFPEARSADEYTTVSPSNRWVNFPYPKLMNAIIAVDMAAALIVMSNAEADRRGIAPEKRVAVLAGATALDPWTPIERRHFFASPGCTAASNAALEHAALDVRDVDLFDLYSCFPCAVEWAADGLGIELDDPRPLSVTGGLASAGGPGNNYATHAIAATVERIRRGDGSVGFVSGLGMSGSKHAACVLSNDPARIKAATGQAPRVHPPAAEVVGPEIVESPKGPASIETYTVAFDRQNQPAISRLIVRLDDGRRSVAHGEANPEAFARLIEHEGVGLRGELSPGGRDKPNLFKLV
jgi:acetyl-CoA C-acetyltransferase